MDKKKHFLPILLVPDAKSVYARGEKNQDTTNLTRTGTINFGHPVI